VHRSIRETVECILKHPQEIAHLYRRTNEYNKRAVKSLPAILEVVDIILSSQLLAPIVVPGGTWRFTPPCRQMKGDIDDGCMRAIAFAIKGYEKFNAYIGKMS